MEELQSIWVHNKSKVHKVLLCPLLLILLHLHHIHHHHLLVVVLLVYVVVIPLLLFPIPLLLHIHHQLLLPCSSSPSSFFFFIVHLQTSVILNICARMLHWIYDCWHFQKVCFFFNLCFTRTLSRRKYNSLLCICWTFFQQIFSCHFAMIIHIILMTNLRHCTQNKAISCHFANSIVIFTDFSSCNLLKKGYFVCVVSCTRFEDRYLFT